MFMQWKNLTYKILSKGTVPSKALLYYAAPGNDQREIYFNLPKTLTINSFERRAVFLHLLGVDVISGNGHTTRNLVVEFYTTSLILDDITWASNPSGTGTQELLLLNFGGGQPVPGFLVEYVSLSHYNGGANIEFRSARLAINSTQPGQLDSNTLDISKDALRV